MSLAKGGVVSSGVQTHLLQGQEILAEISNICQMLQARIILGGKELGLIEKIKLREKESKEGKMCLKR